MKNLFTFLVLSIILSLGFSLPALAQSTLTIGTGTTTSQHLPVEPYYGYTYSQSIFTSSQLGSAKIINKISYYFSGNGWSTPDAVKIYIGNTTKTVFSSNNDWVPLSSLTEVYSATSLAPNGNQGWVEFTLTTPFTYNGTGNLIIAFDENTGGYHSSSDDFRCTSSFTGSSLFYYSDSNNPDPANPPSGTLSAYFPNIKLEYSLPVLVPNNLSMLSLVSPAPLQANTPSVSFPVSIQVLNQGTSAQNNFVLSYSINGGSSFVTETYTGTINVGDTLNYTFTTHANLSSTGTYNFVTAVHNTGDTLNLNDTLQESIMVCVPLSGAYTIGSGSGYDYQTFNDAITALEACGITGPVTFSVAAGTYAETLEFDSITGASATDTITFQGLGESTVINATVNTSNIAAVYFNGAKHIILDSIKVVNANPTMSFFGILFSNSADSNVVRKSFIEVGNGFSNSAGIVSSSSTTYLSGGDNADYLTIENNIIDHGYYGIALRGLNNGSCDYGNKVLNNRLFDQSYYFLYLYYQANCHADGNDLEYGVNTQNTAYGIYTNYNRGVSTINNNRIRLKGGYGMYNYRSNYYGTDSLLISNNFIAMDNSSGSNAYGMRLYYCYRVNVINNSVNTYGGTASSYPFQIYYGSGNKSLNNIFSNQTGAGYGMYVYNSTSFISDYNNIFAPGVTLVRLGGSTYSNLSSWNTASGQDGHSSNWDPLFSSNQDLHINRILLNNTGKPYYSVTDDFDGESRSATHPDMGADEFTPPPHNLAVNNFYSNIGSLCNWPSTIPLTVEIINFGSSAETSFPISYQSDNGQVHTETYSGNLASLDTLIYTFTSPLPTQYVGHHRLGVFTGLTTDSDHNNDSMFVEYDNYMSPTNFPIYEDFEDTNKYFHLNAMSDAHIEIDSNAGNNSNNAILMEGKSYSGWNYTGSDFEQTKNSNMQHLAQAQTCWIDLTSFTGFRVSFDCEMDNSGNIYNNWFYVTINDSIMAVSMDGDSIWNSTPNGSYESITLDLSQYIGDTIVLTFNGIMKFDKTYYNGADHIKIDNVRMWQPVPNDVGVVQVLQKSQNQCGSVSDSLFAVVKNYGTQSQTNIPVTLNGIAGGVVYNFSATLLGPIASNQTGQVFLGMCNTADPMQFYFKTYTTLSTDNVQGNDTNLVNGYNEAYKFIPHIETFENGDNNWDRYDFYVQPAGQGLSSAALIIESYGGGYGESITPPQTPTQNYDGYAIYNKNIGRLSANSYLVFDYNFMENYYFYDSVNVILTPNCGNSPQVVYSFNSSNNTTLQGWHKALVPVGQFAGDVVQMGLYRIDNQSDFVLAFDNIGIANPVPIDLGNDTTLCFGDSLTLSTGLSSSNGYSFLWNGPGTTTDDTLTSYTAHQTGDYWVVVTDSIGIPSIDSIFIRILPQITGNLSTPNSVLCYGDSTEIFASFTGTFPIVMNWTDGSSSFSDTVNNTVSSRYFTPLSNTQYNITSISDSMGCTVSSPAYLSIIVNQLTSLSVSGLNANYCSADSSTTLSVSPSGGTLTGNGIIGNTFDPLVAGPGTHQIYYAYADINNCLNVDTQTTIVYASPIASFVSLIDSQYCANEPQVALLGYPSGGVFSGDGIIGNTFNPSMATSGADTLFYSFTANNGCSNTDTVYTTVLPITPVNITTVLNSSYCEDESSVNLTASPTGGFFTINSDTVIAFDPSNYTGLVDITYNYQTSAGCSSFDTISTIVYSLPAVQITSSLAAGYCQDAPSVALSAYPSGGTFSGGGISGSTFHPDSALIGSQTIVYSYTDGNGCSDSDTLQTTVYQVPTVNISTVLNTSYCDDTAPISLSASPLGGTFTGMGVTGNIFDPATSGSGQKTIIYTYTSNDGCISSDTISTIVNITPNVFFTTQLTAGYCQDAASVNLTAYPTGGTFSGGGVNGSIFYPNSANLGNQTIVYNYTDGNGCSDSDTLQTTVYQVPTVNISTVLNTSYCDDAAPISLSASPSGGTFTGMGVSGNTFDPATSGSGQKSIIYTYTSNDGCISSDTISTIVNITPNVFITSQLNTGYCKDAASVNLTAYPTGGTFSGGGVNGSIFYPDSANLGNQTIVYNYTDGNGCSDSDTIQTYVHALPTVTLGTYPNICADVNQLILTGGSPLGGIYSGNSVNSGSGYFYPSTAGTGLQTIIYTYTDTNGCVNSDTNQIRVVGIPAATFSLANNVCIGDSTNINYTGGASSNATFNWNFANASILSGSNAGPYTVKWDTAGIKALSLVVSDSGCVSQTYSNYTNVLDAIAIVTSIGGSSACYGDSVLLFANSGPGYSYQWFDTAGILTGDTNSFYNALQSGIYHAEVTNNFGCSAPSNPLTVTVYPQILSNFTIPPVACKDDIVSINYNGTPDTTATYNWNFDGGNTASGSGFGPYGIIWNSDSLKNVSLLVSKGGCSSVVTTKPINIITTPAQLTPLGSTTFCDGGSVTLYPNSGANYSYQWFKDGNSLNDSNAYYTATQAGYYTVKVTNNTIGCQNTSDSVQVVVNTTNFNLAFSANQTNFTIQPFFVNFTNQTIDTANYYWAWSMGDGGTYTVANPTHQYNYDGTYTVGVIAQNINTGCYDTLVKNNYITCQGGPPNPCTLVASISPAGPMTICPGDSVLLTAAANSGATYQWLKDGILIPGSDTTIFWAKQTGNYQVMVSDTICIQYSTPFSLSMHTTITPVIASNGSIMPCANDSMELYVTSAFNSYLWSNGQTTSSIYITNSSNYSVIATDINNCKTTSQTFVVNASLLQTPEICIVGVDSATNANFVVWERQANPLIDSFRIYKESSVSGVYNLIGTKGINQPGYFLDTGSNPMKQAYRYQITALDTCGMETPPSAFHKTIHLSINAGNNGSWNLIWSHYVGFNFGSYRIYRGYDSTALQPLTQIQSTLNSYTDLTPPSGKVYYQIEVVSPHPCYPDSVYSKAKTNYNTSRSNYMNTIIDGFTQSKDNNLSMMIMPNPNKGLFTLEIMNKSGAGLVDYNLEFFDAVGNLVYSDKLKGQSHIRKTMHLETLSKGLYIIRLRSNDNLLTSRIIIQ